MIVQKAIFILAWNDDEVVMKGIKTHFDIVFDYLSFKNTGMIFAKGAGTVEMMPKHYLEEAYGLERNL